MKNNYKKDTKVLSTIIKSIGFMILLYIQIKIYKMQWPLIADGVKYFYIFECILKIILTVYILYKLQSPSYKLVWITLILLFPIPSIFLYIIIGNTAIPKSYQEKLNKEYLDSKKYLNYDKKLYNEVKSIDKLRYNQVNYLTKTTGLPIYRNSEIEYFNIGEKYFEALLKDISNAKEYIFLEYFSILEGELWNSILNVLKQKSSEGIKIYIITDGYGNANKYPKNFKKNLEMAKIEYRIFNPLNININKYLNYRDHRKINVIDGNIVYTGGPNIGDEYINVYPKFGHWKDAGVKIIGESITTYIVNFIRIWNLSSNDKKLEYKDFILKNSEYVINKGYIMPYCDGPDNTSNPAQNLYIQMINTAKEYIYITTPYLILDSAIVTALINSAKADVDIRIITPYIPDKPIIHLASRSFYQVLMEAGVKIYEYKPGFIHSKICIVDDELATVGSINFDFRGLYSHYECANWMYKTGVETVIRDDFLEVQEKSIEIKLDDWKKRGLFQKIGDKIFITISPLV